MEKISYNDKEWNLSTQMVHQLTKVIRIMTCNKQRNIFWNEMIRLKTYNFPFDTILVIYKIWLAFTFSISLKCPTLIVMVWEYHESETRSLIIKKWNHNEACRLLHECTWLPTTKLHWNQNQKICNSKQRENFSNLYKLHRVSHAWWEISFCPS